MGACFTFAARQVLVQSPSSSKARSKGVMNKTMIDVPGPLVVLVLLLTKEKNYAGSRRQFFCFCCCWGRHPWGTTHPPKSPFLYPHQTKKSTNLLHFSFVIHLHTNQDLKLKCCRTMGQKQRYGRPCTHDLPGTHNWLAQPHIASISSEFHWLSRAGTILEIWSECCSIGLTHPTACIRARVPLTFGHVHRSVKTPPLT